MLELNSEFKWPLPADKSLTFMAYLHAASSMESTRLSDGSPLLSAGSGGYRGGTSTPTAVPDRAGLGQMSLVPELLSPCSGRAVSVSCHSSALEPCGV